ncbi:MAG: HD domain-containing protein [Candidatus Omnitrophica bacterium]|nr:HD domain-containing protein [Candidatus Omnitrophota bacterium]MCM8792927.1 HD domain-containing protein [Candidatus Omnitrophota bacterium]
MEKDKLVNLHNYLANISPLRDLLILKEKFPVEIFVVGGFIRDFILERMESKEMIEIDFAINREVDKFVHLFAQQEKGHLVLLDEENKTFRVILEKDNLYQFDFSQFRSANIEGDLYARDFTINALAIDLEGVRNQKFLKLIDPTDGFKDIERKVIRVVSPYSFQEDPLRIIRAFTFSQELGFAIEPLTENLAKENAQRLSEVAGERLTEQLFRILEGKFSYKTINRMDALGILEIIFPMIKEMRGIEQGPYHHLDVWKHSLETLKELEILLCGSTIPAPVDKKIGDYLNEKIAGVRTRLFTVKLAALFHDLGKPRTKEITPEGKVRFLGHEKIGADLSLEIVERLKLSSHEKNILTKLIQLHLRPGYLVETKDVSPRAKLRFFRAGEEESVALILIALADKFATRGPLTFLEDHQEFREYLLHLLQVYFYEKELVKPPRLLNGNEIMQILSIPPGPLVGKILKCLEEAQVEKKIGNKKEAEEFVKEIFKKGLTGSE